MATRTSEQLGELSGTALDSQLKILIAAGGAGEFSSSWSALRADSYFGIHSTSVLPQKHVKDAGGR